MLSLITATPGSGKTLKCIELCFQYLNQGYIVFTNIIGLKIPGVYKIESDADWRNLDSFKRTNADLADMPIMIIYDEAHEHPAFSDRDLLKNLQIEYFESEIRSFEDMTQTTEIRAKITKLKSDYTKALRQKKEDILDIGNALTLHRHFGMDIILVTQNPRLIRGEVLAVVGKHLHLRRLFGIKGAMIYEFAEAQANPNSKSVRDDALVTTKWKFPKHLFHYYISTNLDTHKSGIPAKYLAIACIPLLLLGGGIYMMKHSIFAKNLSSDEVVATDKTVDNFNANPAFNSSSQPPVAPFNQQVNNPYGQQSNANQQYTNPQNNTYNYNPSNPYSQAPSVQYEVVNKPYLSGCISMGSRCECYTEQATKLDVSTKDCKRILSGDRPYEYFRPMTASSSYNQPVQQSPVVEQDQELLN